MLAAKLIEFNEFMGAQFRLYKKLMIKFEKSIGGDGDQVEPMVPPPAALSCPHCRADSSLCQLLNMPFARIAFGDLVTILSDVYHSLRKIFSGTGLAQSPLMSPAHVCPVPPPRPDPASFDEHYMQFFLRPEDVRLSYLDPRSALFMGSLSWTRCSSSSSHWPSTCPSCARAKSRA